MFLIPLSHALPVGLAFSSVLCTFHYAWNIESKHHFPFSSIWCVRSAVPKEEKCMTLCAGEVQLSVFPLKSLFIIHKAFPLPGFICAPPAGLPPQANPIQALLQPDVHCTPWPLAQHMLKVYRETIGCNRKMKIIYNNKAIGETSQVQGYFKLLSKNL